MTRGITKFWIDMALLVVMIVTVVPIAWLIVSAFLPNRAIVNSRWDFPFWLGNFEQLFADEIFVRQIANSVGIVLGTVVLTLAIGAIGGYAIAKLNPPKWVLLPSLLVAAFIPLIPPATLVPGFYILLGDLNLLGTVFGLVLVNTFFNLPFALLLMASYFGAVPDELREAAQVDGASESRTFLSVVLPIVRPGMAAVAIFVAIMAWNEFLMGLTLTAGGETAPVTVGIAGLLQSYTVTWGELAAAGTVAAVPIIALAIFANRHIVAGLTAGAVKG
ncbi:carbohydrate ABC transporter permease [Microbacterium sp. NPDC056044]|uniref:carbohydrate ABC transporter permease n=1 Tax=Microbacterium sp. NPDC056044 TaxID=3345690 RepID=UPI0035DEC343